MNQKEIKQILARILESNEFHGSESFCRLLIYLVEKSLNGDPPKESAIAIDVFNKDIVTDNAESSSVRVYIHNLRQKLNSYYLNEGKDEKIRLRIPKGHYQVKFEPIEKNKNINFIKISVFTTFMTLMIILVLFFFNILNFNPFFIKSSINSLIWNEYLNGDKQVLLVFGDYYLYEDLSLPRSRYVRDFQINSKEDFQAFLADHPELSSVYRSSNHTLLGKFALTCLHDLDGFFTSYGKKVDIKLGSSLLWEDLNRNNIVFVGSFKTLRIFKNLLNDHHFEYIIHPNKLFFHDIQNDTTYSYYAPKDHITGQVKDYVIFSRFPGPNKNVITIFSSTHDVGHISTVKYFTDSGSLEEFEIDNLKEKKKGYFFDSLFEVRGYSRTGFQPKLLHIAWIDEK